VNRGGPSLIEDRVALLARAVPGTAPGDLFVDDACIACDTCRTIAPETFGGDEDGVAFVARQPAGRKERRRALMALVACPVAAIGARTKEGIAEAARAFPDPIAPGVLRCGYAAESSFGAASWLVVRDDGNVLVDSPRFAAPLAERVRALGGARLMFLTHRDDVADHARWHEALGCERVLHARDVGRGTREVERRLEGDAPVALAPGLLAVPVPGHTAGSTALLVDETFLFTGDHLWGEAAGRLGASRSVCWWDWDAQIASMERLAALRFEWILPGHGRPWRAPSPEAARAEVLELVREMRGDGSEPGGVYP
jgi:glyoxylase-like metal-dependent hydrolase (beta-lactamase superfamily II)/ferredoxin